MFRRSHHLRPTVPHGADKGIGFKDFRSLRLVRPHKIQRRSFRLFPVQPAVVVPWCRITGIRGWIRLIRSFASVVTMA